MEAFLEAIANLGTPLYWGSVLLAIFLSVLVGMVPGVGSLVVMAILLPFIVFNVDNPAVAIVMLATITGVNNTLDSIPAVIVGIPGGSTQVTFLEGHQLARRGFAAHTLGAIFAVSAMGGVIGALALLAVIPVVRPFILGFDRGEIAMLALFGIAMVGVLSRGAMLKGLASGLFGILVATVGIDPFTGTRRFTFGQIELWEGLPLIAVTTGIFAIPELIDLTMTRRAVAAEGADISRREMLRGARYGLGRWKEAIRQSLFGVFIGAIPGVGASVVDWLAYAFGILWRKDKSQVGKGWLDGVLFAESAQNSKEAGQALPTFALGIPGGASWAIVIAAMLMYGISPGPPMLDQHMDITMLLVITLAIANLIVTMLGLFAAAPLLQLTRIPYPAISAVLIPLVFLAGFLDMRNWFAIPILLAFAVVGFLMKRFGVPRPPFILGFILGPIIDGNIQSAISVHGAVGMMTRPLTIVLFLLVVVTTLLFTYFMGRAEQIPQTTGAEEVPRGGSENGGGNGIVQQARRIRFVMSIELVPPLLMMAAAAAFLITSLEYSPRARMAPFWLSVGILALASFDFLKAAFQTKQQNVQIMDIGMRSKGMEGATRAGFIVAGLIVLFLLLAATIRLDNAAIVFSVILPTLLLSGTMRWWVAGVTGLLMYLWTYWFMGNFMNVIWPTPAFGGWLGF